MAARRPRGKKANSFSPLLDFVEVVDAGFEKLTGKPIAAWLKDFQERAGEAAPGTKPALPPSSTTLDPYAVLGLPRGASPADIKKRYRQLCKIHHPDAGGTVEGFRLIQGAYEKLTGAGKKAGH